VIDAKENRDVATIDVAGAFMQADMEDTVHMKLEGTMADLLINLALDVYKKFAYKHNGKTMLYVLLKKALCGTLKATLLFWKHLSSQLQEWGFELNIYDTCVQTKVSMVRSEQLYGTWMTSKSCIVIQPLSLM